MERGFMTLRANTDSIVAIAKANRIPLVFPKIVLAFPGGATTGCGVCAGLSPLLGETFRSRGYKR